jgi:Fibronectin type III domain
MDRPLIVLLFAAAGLRAQTIPVPSTYQDIYTNLTTQISAFDSAVRASWNGTTSPVIYAPQLEAASAAQYTVLLGTDYYTNAVVPELDELQALGARGVNVHISFPILDQSFYSSNPSQYQQFVSFYQQLAKDIHARGMKMIVEAVVENAFPGDGAAVFQTYYKSLSWNAYMAGRAQNALNIALLIQPDYMSVIVEPDTEASYTGQTNAGTVAGSTQQLQTILTTLHNAGVNELPIGAGAGTWIASFTQYIQSFAATSVQFVDIHIYPINQSYFMNALTAASMIHAAGKQAAISETWDYKLRDSEVGKLSLLQTVARDPFSFWEPVDTAFLKALADFANYEQLAFVSPFWSHYFSAYLDYNTYSADSASTLYLDSETASMNAELVGTFSSTGLAWMNRILSAPDKTAPVVPAAPVTNGVYPPAIMLDWSACADNVGVAGYGVYRNGQLITTTSLLTYFDQGLTPGETYTYNLIAFDASGNVSAPSAALQVETTDTTPPSVPTNLKIVKTTATTIALSWTPSTGIGGIGGYRVLTGTSPTTLKIIASPLTNTYTYPYAQAGKTYYFSVKAFNPLGILSDASAIVSAIVP